MNSKALSWTAILLLTAAVSVLAATAEPTRFVFERLNRAYTTDGSKMAPVERGGIRIEMSSPENTLELMSHTLELAPAGDGSHRGRLEVEFEGYGRLVGKIGAVGMASDLEDEVVIPLQSKVFDGRVEIDRVAGGYLFTALELPPKVEVAIESRLGGRFVGICKSFSRLPLVRLDCSGLDQALSQAVVPLPPPGKRYFLADAELTEDDRKELDRYLRATSAR